LGSKCCLPKNNIFDQNWTDAGLRKHTKKIATRYISLQRLKLATANFVHNLILGLAYQKTTIWTKIDRVGKRYERNCGLPTYF